MSSAPSTRDRAGSAPAAASKSRGHGDSSRPSAEDSLVTTTGTYPALLNPLKRGYDGTAVRHRGVAGQVVTTPARAGIGSLDAYERSLAQLLEAGQKIAGAPPLAWLGALVGAHADVVASANSTYTAVAREALRDYTDADRTATDWSALS